MPRAAVSPVARYQTVKEHIRHRIHQGLWKVGDRIPSEHELVSELGLSRMTIHRALRELAAEGLLQRVAGVGTFVAPEKAESSLLQVANLAQEIRARGHRHDSEVLLKIREAASPEVASRMGLEPGESLFHLVCLHREDGVPVQLEDRYVNPALAPNFLEQPFERVQAGEYLLATVPLDELEHLVEAVAASPELAQQLEIATGDPCLVLNRRTWRHGRIVTFVRAIHPGHRYRLGTRFRPNASSTLG
ncbi:MAG: histidine utilization repressor [Firmicutes bacterium]|nr:histidine utilization repressor [Bacillota bacterium]